MAKRKQIADVRYFLPHYKKHKAETSRDVYYTIKMLKNNSDSWENLYKKLQYFPEEKSIFDLYRNANIKWENLNIIALVRN